MTRKPEAIAAPTRSITLERTYSASIEESWEMWTTKDGIESWWGPGGFEVKVLSLDLRPGGHLVYAMTATGAEQREFMKRAKMPLTTETRITFTEVEPPRRLAYTNHADFIPGVAPYDVTSLVELYRSDSGVRLVLTQAAMHDDEWTRRAAMGWEQELGKLGQALLTKTRGP